MTIETVRVALKLQQTEITTWTDDLTKNEQQISLSSEKFDNIYLYQQDIFDKSVLPLVKLFFEGKHVTVLTFGQTSSGTQSLGVYQEMIPKLLDVMYKEIGKSHIDYQVDFTFTESHNESFIHQNTKSDRILLSLLEIAAQKRNCSDIFHAIVTVHLSLKQKLFSRFHFIELGGSPKESNNNVLDEMISAINNNKNSSSLSTFDDSNTSRLSVDSLLSSNNILVLACINAESSDSLNILSYVQQIEKIDPSVRLQIDQLRSQIPKTKLKSRSKSIPRDTQLLGSENHNHLPLQMTDVPSSKSSGKKVTSSLSSNRRHSNKKKPVVYRMKSSTSSNHKRKNSNNHHQHMLELLELLNDEVYTEHKQEEQLDILSLNEVHPTEELISPTDPVKHIPNQEDELEALAVPSWTDIPKAQSNQGSVKRQSISVDSMWDDTDSSLTSIHKPIRTKSKPSQSKEAKRSSRNLIKMLHQVQADLLVKRELVGQLEKSEGQYSQMRSNYEQRLKEYKTYLNEVQEQRDSALVEAKKTPSIKRATSVLELRENRQAQEVRSQYEVKMKRLIAENTELKKKNTQTTQQFQTARVKSDTAIQRLKQDMEKLKTEKKQLVRQLKQESDRARESTTLHQKEIQQLKRRLMMTTDAKKKAEELNQVQAQALKKKTDDAIAVNLQLKQLTLALRKVAAEGTVLNEVTLEKLLKPRK